MIHVWSFRFAIFYTCIITLPFSVDCGGIDTQRYKLMANGFCLEAPGVNVTAGNALECGKLCSEEEFCMSYNTLKVPHAKHVLCTLLSSFAQDLTVLVAMDGGRYYKTEFPLIIGGPLEMLPFLSGDNYNIFVSLSVPKSGRITAWGFYAKVTGKVFASIWRPLGGWNFRLVGKNKLTANTIGKHVSHIEVQDQIQVLAGDVVGLHYADVTDAPYIGVIPYADSRFPICCGLSVSALHQFSSALGLGDETFLVGTDHFFPPYASIFRTPALAPFVDYD